MTLLTASCSGSPGLGLASCLQSKDGEIDLHLCTIDESGALLQVDYLVEIQERLLDEDGASLEERIVPISSSSLGRFEIFHSESDALAIEAIEISIYKSREHLDQIVEPIDLLVCDQCRGWRAVKSSEGSNGIYEVWPAQLSSSSVAVITVFSFDDVGTIMKSWAVEIE